MISNLKFVPRGRAKALPERFELDDAMLAEMEALHVTSKHLMMKQIAEEEGLEMATETGSDAEEGDNDDDVMHSGDDSDEDESAMASGSSGRGEAPGKGNRKQREKRFKSRYKDTLAKYNLDDYDKEDGTVVTTPLEDLMPPNDTEYEDYEGADGAEDAGLDAIDEDDLDDLEDMTIRPTDSLIVAATMDSDEFCHLDVYVYEPEENNFYVHHDIMLETPPLAVEWLDATPRNVAQQGNFVAVASFLPAIELWNLDVLDALQPVALLGGSTLGADLAAASSGSGAGGAPKSKNQRKKDRRAQKKQHAAAGASASQIAASTLTGHTAPVLSLSWNRHNRQLLASGSADHTVKLWDLNSLQCVATFSHHKNKVQAVAWNPTESTILLTGSHDGTVAVLDVKTGKHRSWAVEGEIECLEWDPHTASRFFVTTDRGMLQCFNLATPGTEAVWSLQVHRKSASALAVNPLIRHLVATGSEDKSFALWDVSGLQPVQLHRRTSPTAAVFTLAFCPDSPLHLAVGGVQGKLYVFNCADVDALA
eukprot:CAMPEP_0174236638 /NCGR_PEP_ID=MMETSP0417-20130205/5707_1 /TAXON_ID=242541 /ORGANISM="Mayorella sp, Strain BSH-02190019" /LENGTH=535 /DNA_ID=CAMNT_0015315309 /DNA_START=229 /DNA_END=1832 /DNA_ORIENTATION=+